MSVADEKLVQIKKVLDEFLTYYPIEFVKSYSNDVANLISSIKDIVNSSDD